MDSFDASPPGAVPPPSDAAVWPPPPSVAGAVPAVAAPFKWLYRRASGKVAGRAFIADFREGLVQLEPQGLVIQGKVVPRAEIRLLVLIPCLLISVLIAVVANAVMEYGMRKDQWLAVPWSSVREVLLSPTKQQAVLIYDAPNYAGIVKTFSLAFTPTPGYYETFASAARQYAPGAVTEGRLRNATSPIVWGALALVVLVLTAGLYVTLTR